MPCALVLCEALSELVQTDSHDVSDKIAIVCLCMCVCVKVVLYS